MRSGKFLSSLRDSASCFFSPTAYAVGCIVSPLRGWVAAGVRLIGALKRRSSTVVSDDRCQNQKQRARVPAPHGQRAKATSRTALHASVVPTLAQRTRKDGAPSLFSRTRSQSQSQRQRQRTGVRFHTGKINVKNKMSVKARGRGRPLYAYWA